MTDSTTTEHASAVRYSKDTDKIVTLLLDDPQSSANMMNERYATGMAAALDKLEADATSGDLTGVILASAKKTFFAGGDLVMLKSVQPEDAGRFFEQIETLKAQLRRLEQIGKPVVAALNGAALGGGMEIALAAHHRIAVDNPAAKFGFPEVTLGLLPGGGGVTRTVRMLGLQSALMDWLMQGQQRGPALAKEKGLVDDIVDTPGELLPAARAWILANTSDVDAATQP
ncbi:MAG: enoyl-CoA hydratase/isomerase family protein, partial [Allobranchiibius sp.]